MHKPHPNLNPSWFDRHSLVVLAIIVLVGTLLSSGRISSGDTGSQLDAATLLVREGRLWAPEAVGPSAALWVRSPSNTYFQCHDLASQLVLVPAAFLGRHQEPMRGRAPLAARAVAGYTYTIIGCITTWLIYQAFSVIYARQQAFCLSMLFYCGTIFCAYTKSAWDVCGGAMGVAGIIVVLMRAIHSGGLSWTSVVGIAAWTALACSFRFSLYPFLGVALVLIVLKHHRTWPAKRIIATAGLFLILMVPQLMFNAVRTGSPLKPATVSEQFDSANKLDGNPLIGVTGLLISPNKGLVWYTPAFLLLLSLPWYWKKLPPALQETSTAMLVAAVLYICLIGCMRNWGSFGWGPRYLLPILPMLFLPLAGTLMAFQTNLRKYAIALALLGVAINSVAIITNWHIALSGNPAANDPLAAYPVQQIITWRAAWLGVNGIKLAHPDSQKINDGFGEFPDLLLARIFEVSAAGKIAAYATGIIGVMLLGILIRLSRSLTTKEADSTQQLQVSQGQRSNAG